MYTLVCTLLWLVPHVVAQLCASETCDAPYSVVGLTPPSPPALPSRLNIGYANWAQCDDGIVRAVENGLNAVIWFSITLSRNASGAPEITGAVPDLECVAGVVESLRARGHDVLHLISLGGWNTPLPDAAFSPERWFRAFHEWNRGVVARPTRGWLGFDGIDWDAEGNDDVHNPANQFTLARMQLIGEMSVLAKAAGYLVSMAPAQSYLDADTTAFDLQVDHVPAWRPGFHYHGHNLYAYWLVKYGQTRLRSGQLVPTFDWMGVQLYEGWSRANDAIAGQGVPVEAYIRDLVQRMQTGWRVQFTSAPEVGLESSVVRVPADRLVIGLANGWTAPYPPQQKFLLLEPEQLARAYRALPDDLKPRGFMFWNIADEGSLVRGKPLYLAAEVAAFMAGE